MAFNNNPNDGAEQGHGIHVLDLFPVGYIWLSTVNKNPSEYIGGTWVQIKDKFLLCAGDTYAGGSTGGEASHTLTVSEMPSHRHTTDHGVWNYASSDHYGLNYGSGTHT